MMVKKFIIGMLLGATISVGHALETSALSQKDTVRQMTPALAKSQEAVPEGRFASPGNIMVNLVHSKAMSRVENVLSVFSLIIVGLVKIQDIPYELKDKAFGVVKIGVGVVLGLKTLQYIFSQDEDKEHAKRTFEQKAWKYLYSFAGHAPTVAACALSMWIAHSEQKKDFYSLWGNTSK